MSISNLTWTFSDDIECGVCYLLFIGFIYFVVFLIGSAVTAAMQPRTAKAIFRRIGKLGLFLLILLVIGDLFSQIWGDTVWGRFYRSTDYCGTDFLPFLPITPGLIEAPFGSEPHGLLGVTLAELNLIWLGFAAATWGITLEVYRRIMALSGWMEGKDGHRKALRFFDAGQAG